MTDNDNMSDYFFAKKDVDSADIMDAGKAEKLKANVSGDSFPERDPEIEKIRGRTRA